MECIREDTTLGNKKIIVGDKYHDLVLENLGRIYVRYGNGYKEFNEIIKALSKSTSSKNSVVICDVVGDPSEYSNGTLIYESSTGTLYLVYDGTLLLLLEHVNVNDEKYVRKTGDTMSGQLVINTSGPPLIVRSSEVVKNFNANYLNGLSGDEFAVKHRDEEITGDWTFEGQTRFNDTVTFGRTKSGQAIIIGTDSITTDGNLGSSNFVSGMTGTGWRLDANTNTLEIDNLIVRGILNVFELVVNKISATNGSFWVTDSFKVKKVHDFIYLDCQYFNAISALEVDTYYIPFIDDSTTIYSITDSFETIYENTSSKNCYKISVPKSMLSRRDGTVADDVTTTFFKFHFFFKITDKVKFVEAVNSVGVTSLASCDVMTQLAAMGAIEKVNFFQKNTTLASEDEVVTYEDTETRFTPIDGTFDRNYYTIVKGSAVSLNTASVYSFNSKDDIVRVNLYYKYFGEYLISNPGNTSIDKLNNLFIIVSEEGEYPVFKPGDILKCQKFSGKDVKQYHAIVLGTVDAYGIVIELQNTTPIDTTTVYNYNLEGNLAETEQGNALSSAEATADSTLYNRSATLDKAVTEDPSIETSEEAIEDLTKGLPAKDDVLVRIGSIFDTTRRNSLMLTSSEANSPYQDVLINVNRPDYSVGYLVPKYKTFTSSYEDSDGIIRKGQFYLQDEEFGNIIKYGDQIVESSWDNAPAEARAYFNNNEETWLSKKSSVYDVYRQDTVKYEIPVSKGNKGKDLLDGIQLIKDANLTYQVNSDSPIYYNKNGGRVMISVDEEYANLTAPVEYYTSSDLKATVVNTMKSQYTKDVNYKPNNSDSYVTLSLGQIV